MHTFPKKSRLLFLATLLTCIFLTSSAIAANFSLRNDTAIIFTDLSGSGQSSSSLTEGTRHYSVLDLKTRGKFYDYNYSLTLGFKATDDERRDVENFSITNLRGRISNQNQSFNVGDTYKSFSKYSLNTAVKGASYRYANDGNNLPDITLLGGIVYSRWDNFWDNDTTERKLYGARVKQNLIPDLWLAASVVTIKDDDRNFGSPLYDGNTLTFDLEYQPLPGLTLIAESSFSHMDEDSLTSGTIEHHGQAYRIEAIGDQDPSRVVLEYERISPDYLTIAGSATPDREKIKASWRYRYTKRLTVTSAFLWYRDNLDGQLAVRTQHYKPEIKFSLQRLFNRRYANGSLGYKFDRSYSSTASTKNHFVSTSYRDRFGIFDSTTNLGVTFYDTKETRENDEFLANTSLRARITKGIVTWKPAVYLGTWRSDNELTDDVDYIYEYSLGLGCDIPSKKITSELKVGQHKLLKDSADDAERLFASLNIYYRPKLYAKLKNSTLYLRGLINDYSYSTDSRNFRENRITAGFSVRF